MEEKDKVPTSSELKSVDEILGEVKNEEFNSSITEEEVPLEEQCGISMSKTTELPKKYKSKKKSRRGIKTIVYVSVILAISIAIAALFLMICTDVIGISKSDKEIEVIIPKGATTEQIADILEKEGAIEYPFLFRVFSKINKADGLYQYGTYYVKSSGGYEGIIDTLQQVGSFAKQVEVRIPQGTNIDKLMKLFAKKGICTESEFKQAMDKDYYLYDFVQEIPNETVYYLLEGYIYPETYNFYQADEGEGLKSAIRAIDKALSELDSKWTTQMREAAVKQGMSFHEVMTLASIVELEASGYYDEMPKVAKVFLNRLDEWDHPLLGSTPTAKYPHGSGRYDTNKYEGLPPGPLCSPSVEAIKAVLYPDKSIKETYFVTDKNKKFYFTNSLYEHETLIAKLKQQGIWEY